MSDLAIVNARILTLAGETLPRRGDALRRLGVIERGSVQVTGDRIAVISSRPDDDGGAARVLDARGRVLLPAFVDCHTHACWAGDRFDEFEMKLGGASYLDILQAGGGIMSTVAAVRDAAPEHLLDLLLQRLARMAALGTATVEVKSGYGLDTESELKMLRTIAAAADVTPLTVVPTFLGAHAKDPMQPDFVERTIEEMLPAVTEAFPGITCDAYCEEGAWSRAEVVRLFEAAQARGCPLRVHADQFHSLGMTRAAVELGAVSVDHLEATTPEDLACLASSETLGVALPCSGFHLDDRYAPARAFIDAGGALAIATNYNPGSAPTPSLPFTIALACRRLRLTPAEAISCCTVNAACVLGRQQAAGSLEPGRRADLQLLDATDERELGYELATPGPAVVVIGGRIVHERRSFDAR